MPPPLPYQHAGKAAIIGIIIIGLVPTLASIINLPYKLQKLWFSNNNIIFLLTSWMLVVFAFRHHTYNKVVNTLASSVLAIYLITDSAQLRPYDKDIFPIVLEWWGYLVAMGICLGCILIDKVRIFLTESFIKIITRVIKRRK